MARRRSRPQIHDDAFVLRTHKLGEADRIVVLLTAHHGVVRAVAKGVRKINSRFGSRLDRFARVNVVVYVSPKGPHTGLGTVTSAELVTSYAGPICSDPECYQAASAMLEMAQLCAGDPDAAPIIFDLLDASLAGMVDFVTTRSGGSEVDPTIGADEFVLGCLDAAGWPPSLVDCAQCGRPGPHRAFHPDSGGAVCVQCRPLGSRTPDPQAVRLLWLLSHRRYEVLPASVRREAHELLVAYVRAQLDTPARAFASL